MLRAKGEHSECYQYVVQQRHDGTEEYRQSRNRIKNVQEDNQDRAKMVALAAPAFRSSEIVGNTLFEPCLYLYQIFHNWYRPAGSSSNLSSACFSTTESVGDRRINLAGSAVISSVGVITNGFWSQGLHIQKAAFRSSHNFSTSTGFVKPGTLWPPLNSTPYLNPLK